VLENELGDSWTAKARKLEGRGMVGSVRQMLTSLGIVVSLAFEASGDCAYVHLSMELSYSQELRLG
jgi:hypothetical protein